MVLGLHVFLNAWLVVEVFGQEPRTLYKSTPQTLPLAIGRKISDLYTSIYGTHNCEIFCDFFLKWRGKLSQIFLWVVIET